MSETQAPVVPVVATEPAVTEPTTALPEATTAVETTEPVAAPATETKAEETPVAPEEAAAVEDKKEEKIVEPITEGQLAYKGPGLVKSLIPSKKEFWLSDEAVPAQNLDLYLRGEKPEVAHSVVAWATQTGKGLLFFNKKGDTNREHPHSILALYDATDLKKQSPNEISFRLNGHPHTLKAATDAERDGWYLSIEKSAELGKVEKETLRETEGYKAELEKLSKPAVAATATGAAVAARSKSQGKKSTEIDRAQRPGSDAEEEDSKKEKKARSTSRGLFSRVKGKKEELEAKKEEKEEEKKEEQAEAETAEAAPVEPVVAPVVPAEEAKEETAAEPVAADAVVATDAEEKPKPAKRGSIFGKIQGWGSVKSPAREKDIKEAELKPEVPAKDEAAPQIPESVTADATEPITEITPAVEAPKETEAVSPTTQKSNFLSGLPFINKRNRSVSPSTPFKEASKKEETAEPVAATEPVVTEPSVEAAAAAPTEEAAVEEPAKTETANKRQSVFGNLGRRASKALNRMQAPKKDAPAASTEAAKDETTEEAVAPVEADKPAEEAVTESEKPVEANPASIGDVVPEAVNVGQPQSTPTVTASA